MCSRRGIGKIAIVTILADANEKQLPVTLQVFKINPAYQLYERLGFKIVETTATHYRMST